VGPVFDIARSAFAAVALSTENVAETLPTPLLSIVLTVQIPTCANWPAVGIAYVSVAGSEVTGAIWATFPSGATQTNLRKNGVGGVASGAPSALAQADSPRFQVDFGVVQLFDWTVAMLSSNALTDSPLVMSTGIEGIAKNASINRLSAIPVITRGALFICFFDDFLDLLLRFAKSVKCIAGARFILVSPLIDGVVLDRKERATPDLCCLYFNHFRGEGTTIRRPKHRIR
jgi:hypothetical protein